MASHKLMSRPFLAWMASSSIFVSCGAAEPSNWHERQTTQQQQLDSKIAGPSAYDITYPGWVCRSGEESSNDITDMLPLSPAADFDEVCWLQYKSVALIQTTTLPAFAVGGPVGKCTGVLLKDGYGISVSAPKHF